MEFPRGIIAATLTPMTDTEDVDLNGVRTLSRACADAGVDGIFALGSAAEQYALENDERVAIVEATLEAVDGRIPVFAGIGVPTTRGCLELAKLMAKLPVAGVSAVTPYFAGLSQQELIRHYNVIADASEKPVIIYNIPPRTNINLLPETAAVLAKHPNIIGIKDSSGDIEQVRALVEQCGPDFAVYAGIDSGILAALQFGAAGAVSAPTSACPFVPVAIVRAFREGNIERAEQLQALWNEFSQKTGCGTFPAGIKYASDRIFEHAGPPRSPVAPISEEDARALDAYLASHDWRNI